jgi:hypothetical protein
MSRQFLSLALLLSLCFVPLARSATKAHIITFGKPTPTKFQVGQGEEKHLNLKVRPLYVDTRLKEYTIGAPHEVTERLFVVRRGFRLNDTLPDESAAAPRWQWQRGGWLLVDRMTARISRINLPEFDTLVSAASWYRDYIAYCGVSDDGKRLFAVVAQLGRRKPVMKKLLGEGDSGDTPDEECSMPTWQRDPIRVTFESPDGKKLTFSIRGQVVDVVNDKEDEPESSE